MILYYLKYLNIKLYLITGASSGIGYAAAKAFAKRGENLILIARRDEPLRRLKSEILADCSDLSAHKSVDTVIKICDLSVSENVYKIYDELKDYEIKTWINNAGFGDYSLVGEQNLDKIQTMINLNITALTIFSSLFVRDY
ncbi:MAG: SDR family NAD(P)-dependent oxidoreductase [Campylobacter sp.]|nr:SDR family NAD(P)-dependent oxidoreductase [Campylobacter sp.]